MSQKDDVHLCIMCLRAIMNYQVLMHLLSVFISSLCVTPNDFLCVKWYWLQITLTTVDHCTAFSASCHASLLISQFSPPIVVMWLTAVSECVCLLSLGSTLWWLTPAVSMRSLWASTTGTPGKVELLYHWVWLLVTLYVYSVCLHF